jgi:hypothetical protein
MKREKAARDECQQEMMQQIMMQVFFMLAVIASNSGGVHDFMAVFGVARKAA